MAPWPYPVHLALIVGGSVLIVVSLALELVRVRRATRRNSERSPGSGPGDRSIAVPTRDGPRTGDTR